MKKNLIEILIIKQGVEVILNKSKQTSYHHLKKFICNMKKCNSRIKIKLSSNSLYNQNIKSEDLIHTCIFCSTSFCKGNEIF